MIPLIVHSMLIVVEFLMIELSMRKRRTLKTHLEFLLGSSKFLHLV